MTAAKLVLLSVLALTGAFWYTPMGIIPLYLHLCLMHWLALSLGRGATGFRHRWKPIRDMGVLVVTSQLIKAFRPPGWQSSHPLVELEPSRWGELEWIGIAGFSALMILYGYLVAWLSYRSVHQCCFGGRVPWMALRQPRHFFPALGNFLAFSVLLYLGRPEQNGLFVAWSSILIWMLYFHFSPPTLADSPAAVAER